MAGPAALPIAIARAAPPAAVRSGVGRRVPGAGAFGQPLGAGAGVGRPVAPDRTGGGGGGGGGVGRPVAPDRTVVGGGVRNRPLPGGHLGRSVPLRGAGGKVVVGGGV